MSSRNAYSEIPNLSHQHSDGVESTRAGDPSRFFAPVSGGVLDSVTARILNVPKVSVFRNAGVVPATAAPFIVTWDSVEYDTGGMWDPLNPTRITSKIAGVYDIDAWGQWASSVGWRRMLLTKVDAAGVSTLYSDPGDATDPAGGAPTSGQCIHYPVALHAGEYVTITVTQFSGGGLAFNGATATSRVNGFTATLKSTFGSES